MHQSLVSCDGKTCLSLGLTVLCETKRNEMVLCETVLCEMVLCETATSPSAISIAALGKTGKKCLKAFDSLYSIEAVQQIE